MLSARDYITKGRAALRRLRGLGTSPGPSPRPPEGPTPQEEPDAPASEHPRSAKKPPTDNDPKEAPPWPPI